jgi:sporulation protein YlmC with PRC-barrel domain
MNELAVLSASSIVSDSVRNPSGEPLGFIEDLMIDLRTGAVRYAVVSFGGFLGLGDKLFAVPFSALEVDTANERLVLDADRSELENAPGFDNDAWPDFGDPSFTDPIEVHHR